MQKVVYSTAYYETKWRPNVYTSHNVPENTFSVNYIALEAIQHFVNQLMDNSIFGIELYLLNVNFVQSRQHMKN